MKVRLAIFFMALAFGLCAGLAAAAPARADNWFGNTGKTGCNSGNMADNSGQNYEYTALTTQMANATDWARVNSINPTIVDTWMDQTPDEHTDVLVTDAYYHTLCGFNWIDGDTHSGAVGLTTCEKTTSVGNCDQHLVRETSGDQGARVRPRGLRADAGRRRCRLGQRIGTPTFSNFSRLIAKVQYREDAGS